MFSPFSEGEARRIAVVVGLGVIASLAYAAAIIYLLFGVDRVDTVSLLLAVGLGAPGYYILATAGADRSNTGFWLGLGLRVAALFAFPLLSDDVYRFLWDGSLWWAGIHPFTAAPEVLAAGSEGEAFAKTYAHLLDNMNSAGYFTVYPTLSQVVFALGGLIDNAFWGSVVIKLVLILGELGVWWFLRKLPATLEGSTSMALLYWLNPLVIVEIMGNAHFEGLALLCILAAVYALRRAGLGWARQGSVKSVKHVHPVYGSSYESWFSTKVGPGLPPADIALVPRTGEGVWWRWVLTAAAALAAATLVKLVPLLLAPAFSLSVLWVWTRRPVFDDEYYDFLPQTWRAKLRKLAGSSVVEEVAPTETRDMLTDEERYILAGEWPYGHSYEVVPPSSAELHELRKAVLQHNGSEAVRGREEAMMASSVLGGKRVTFPILRGGRTWQWVAAVGFGASLVTMVCGGLALLLIGSGVAGFGESLDLYFRSFEFNGSLYGVASALGTWYKGWNWIAVVGPGLSVASFASIVGVSIYRCWRGLDLATTLLYCMGIYLLCATTVHPWYFVYLIGMSVLTPFRWPLVLGLTAFLSYAAYGVDPVAVPVWALCLEYVPVMLGGFLEHLRRRKPAFR